MTAPAFPMNGPRPNVSDSDLPDRIFVNRGSEFLHDFNHRAFPFAHNLAGHPLFSIPRLVELSKTLWTSGEGRVIFQTGDTRVDRRWDDAPRGSVSVMDAIRRIDESGSWVLLKGVQKDPAYRNLLDQAIAELEELTEVDLRREITWMDAYVFIASPHCVTPYHMDHESNFLLQIQGDKEDNLFDGGDPLVLSDEEIEHYYVGNLSGAKYRETVQTRANVFRLVPGTGVHHPVRWPHWVRNGARSSVSLSILFFLREYDRQARAYQFNHFLRRLHVKPKPPGRSPVRDRVKTLVLESFARGQTPTSKDEVLRSGLARFEGAVRFAESALGRFRRGASPR